MRDSIIGQHAPQPRAGGRHPTPPPITLHSRQHSLPHCASSVPTASLLHHPSTFQQQSTSIVDMISFSPEISQPGGISDIGQGEISMADLGQALTQTSGLAGRTSALSGRGGVTGGRGNSRSEQTSTGHRRRNSEVTEQQAIVSSSSKRRKGGGGK